MNMHDLVGASGAILIAGTYFAVQLRRMHPNRPLYPAVNAVGAGAILWSLYFEFNLAAALMEGFWLLASLVGIWKSLPMGRRDTDPK